MSDRTGVVALAAQAPKSPAFRIRLALLGPHLAQHGVDLTPAPLFSDNEADRFAHGGVATKAQVALRARQRLRGTLRRLPETVSVAVVQRQADFLPSNAVERQAAEGRRLVLDVDDAIWHLGRGSGSHAFAFLKGIDRKLRWLTEHADHVVAGNQILAEYLADRTRRVTIVPSLVDVDAVPVRHHEDAPQLRIGWIGSSTTVPYLEAKRQVLERLADAVPGAVELVVVGGSIAPVRGVTTTVHPWSEAQERKTLAGMDVGLMPLPDTEFSRGKCAYKALQYMASGIPVVADDVGISAQVIGHEASGFIASSDDEWVDSIATLAADPDLRATLGIEGRARVARDFSYTRWVPELADLLAGRS